MAAVVLMSLEIFVPCIGACLAKMCSCFRDTGYDNVRNSELVKEEVIYKEREDSIDDSTPINDFKKPDYDPPTIAQPIPEPVQQPSYNTNADVAPQQQNYGAPQQPNYGAPQQPNYGAPQQANYSAPQQPNYGAP